MKKHKTKRFSKSILTSLLIGFGLCFSFQPKLIAHAGNSGYVLGIAPDFNRFMYQTTIATEDHNVNSKNYSEFESLNVPANFSTSIPESTSGDWKADKGGNKETMFLFPANNSNAATNGPDPKDSEAITRVTTQVLNQLNQAISFIMTNATEGGKPLIANNYNESQRKELFFEITAKLGNESIKMKPENGYSGTITIKDTTFKLTKKSNKSSFLTLETSDGKKSVELRYRIQKYPEGKTEGTSDYDRSGNLKTVYWFHLVWMGNSTFINRGVEASNISKLGSEGFVAEFLYGLLDNALQGIRSKLGLETISNIVFNQGNFKAFNWNGIAPTAWFEAGNILFWICQILAWLSLALALVWRFGSTMWGTVSPYKRVTLIEGIKDIFTASISTAFIYPIFTVLTKFNVLLVDIMANLTIFNDHIDSSTVGGGTIAGILLAILFFGIEVYFNFVYLLRGVTIVLLYGMAPMFFMVYAFGGNFKGITFKFIKELVGNIFIHTFHATFLAFFAIFMNTASTGFFTQLVLLYAFIPMTKLFKQLTGIGESDFISSTAEQAKDTFKSAGNAALGGAIGGFTAGKIMKGGSKGGDNGGGGGGGSFKGDSMSDGFGGDTAKSSLTGRVAQTVGNKISNSTAGRAVSQTTNAVLNKGKNALNSTELGAKALSKASSVAKTAKGLYQSDITKGVAKTALGVGKAAAGVGVATSGAILGNKELTKAGRTMTSNGVGGTLQSGKALASDLEEKLHGREVQSLNEAHIGGYYNDNGTRTDTYDKATLHETTGVEDMDLIQGKNNQQIFRQKIDPSKLSDDTRNFLESIETDASGNVESAKLREMGLNNVKKTQDGKYIMSYDAEKRGVNSVKRSANKLVINQVGSNAISLDHLNHIYNDFNKQAKEDQHKKAFML